MGFHLLHDFHRAMLEPIHALLKDEFPCLLTGDVERLIAFQPQVLVLADQHFSLFRERLPGTVVVWVRHGFATKKLVPYAATGCDFACVSSEWVREEFIRLGWLPRFGFWVTGFVPLDGVLRSATESADRAESRAGGPTLLYAPTHNPSLSSAEVLGNEWIDRLQSSIRGLNVIIKPHPVTPERNPEWMAMWREAAFRNPRTVLIEDAHSSVYEHFRSADILLSDASSVVFYFLVLDRPIILVTNPRRSEDAKHFDPEGPEWGWRNLGIEIRSPQELPDAVLRSLREPGEKAKERALYRQRIFGDLCDGRAAERIAERIRELLRPAATAPHWVEITWNCMAAIRLLREANAALLRTIPIRLSRRFDRFPQLKSALRGALRLALGSEPSPIGSPSKREDGVR